MNKSTPPLNKNMDRKLWNDVHDSVRSLFYDLHTKEESEPFTINDLRDALVARGYSVDEDEEHIKPYMGYMWYTDYIALVNLRNGDCCLKQFSNDTMKIFADSISDYSITLNDISLAQTVDIIAKIDDALPEIISTCQEKILKEEKKAKLYSVNCATVKTVIETALKDTGIQYKLSFSEHKALLTLKLDRGLETKFYLSFKDFMKKVPHIKTTVEQLNSIMQNLDQPLRIKSTYYRAKDTWTESK